MQFEVVVQTSAAEISCLFCFVSWQKTELFVPFLVDKGLMEFDISVGFWP